MDFRTSVQLLEVRTAATTDNNTTLTYLQERMQSTTSAMLKCSLNRTPCRATNASLILHTNLTRILNDSIAPTSASNTTADTSLFNGHPVSLSSLDVLLAA